MKQYPELINKVFEIVSRYCGEGFKREFLKLKEEREKYLISEWGDIPPTDLGNEERRTIFREIDYDTMLSMAHERLQAEIYYTMLYEIAETCIIYGELEKSLRLCLSISMHADKKLQAELISKSCQKLGEINFQKNNWTDAERFFRKSKRIYTEIGNKEGIATTENSLGILFVEQGKFVPGERYFKSSLQKAEQINHELLIAKINDNLGNVATIRGEYEKSISYYNKSLEIAGKENNFQLMAQIHHNLGMAYKSMGDLDRASFHFDQSINYSDMIGNLRLKGLSYLEKAEIHNRKSEFGSTTALAITAFRIFSEIGDYLSLADTYKLFGMVNREKQNWQLAESYFRNSLKINEDLKNHLNMGETYFELAVLYKKRGLVNRAKENFEKSASHFKKANATAKLSLVEEEIRNLAK